MIPLQIRKGLSREPNSTSKAAVKKAKHQRIDAFECGVGEDS